ncbi:MAG: (2Fe-2S)-binding protein [Nitrospinota bacterium]|jgi:carbon-monoxide dehydrogenase small subunit|nr:(2Fe-2S)-binding protein [Nitrospinota bacterium]MDP6618214.1 (2Fe-2S)-binding protein [Nitrospinota bacterium]HJM43732.1 (2Fe-2S)-binding protein [Nitrospinota bacterium]
MGELEPKRQLSVRLEVNGRPAEGETEARKSLADFLREDLRLTGTHVGCEQGVCGACTVLLDGEPVRSCLLLAAQAEGRSVETVEGLAPPEGPLHPIQEAFHIHHALQCGFCTPGFLMTLKAALSEARDWTRDEIRELLSGNICRCTGYHHIVDAVEKAAGLLHPK